MRLRFLPFLLTSLTLLSTAFAAAGKDSQAGKDKETKLQRINNLAISSFKTGQGPIVLTDKLYDDLTTGPRNYTALVLLTALESRFGCDLCKQFQPEYELLANSWMKQRGPEESLFFSYLDFADGRATFHKLGLTSAPILYLFPATYGPAAPPAGSKSTEPLRYEFARTLQQAEPLSRWISQQTPYHPRVSRPPPYKLYFLIFSTTVILCVSSYFLLPVIYPLLVHPTLWAAGSLISILLFISGHMFNHIRKTPYMQTGPNGQISYIAGGFGTQFAVESQIVGVVYAFLAFGTIALAMKIPRMKEEGRQRVAVVVWSGVLLCLFSFLMGVFKVKNPGYPFWLPPLMGRI